MKKLADETLSEIEERAATFWSSRHDRSQDTPGNSAACRARERSMLTDIDTLLSEVKRHRRAEAVRSVTA